jgi:hypothetical protein
MLLIAIATLRARCGLTGTTDDSALQRAIEATGALFEAHINRDLARTVGVTHIVRANTREILLPRCPVEAVTTFELKYSEADAWATLTNVTHVIDPLPGIVSLASAQAGAGALLRITYTGGYRLPADVAGTYYLPDALTAAATEQAAWFYQHRHAGRLTGTPGASPSVKQTQERALLESVEAMLAPFRRVVM